MSSLKQLKLSMLQHDYHSYNSYCFTLCYEAWSWTIIFVSMSCGIAFKIHATRKHIRMEEQMEMVPQNEGDPSNNENCFSESINP